MSLEAFGVKVSHCPAAFPSREHSYGKKINSTVAIKEQLNDAVLLRIAIGLIGS